HEGDVQHHPGRQAEAAGQHLRAGAPSQHTEGGTDGRGPSGEEGEEEGGEHGTTLVGAAAAVAPEVLPGRGRGVPRTRTAHRLRPCLNPPRSSPSPTCAPAP